MKRILSAILFGALIAASLASCGDGAAADAPAATAAGDETAAVTTAEETTARIKADIPEDTDFDGYNYRMMIRDANIDTRIYTNFDFDAESGDALQDGIYRRNLNVEELLNVKISQLPATTPGTELSKAVLAGDDLCDSALTLQNELYSDATAGVLVNLYDVPYLNLNSDWWDASLARDLTVNDKLFYDTGEITVLDDCVVYCSIFNKAMWADNDLENPYDLVLNGVWTLDKMLTLTAGVNRDVNGDGQMDKNDVWGFSSEYAGGRYLFAASGERSIRNDNGDMTITFGNERSVAAAEKVLTALSSSEVLLGDTVKDDLGTWPKVSLMFQQDQILMRTTSFEPVPRDLRQMDADFGVLPLPKLDETQDSYYSDVAYSVTCCGIPVTADIERTGAVLEALAVESLYTVHPGFYEMSLQGKVLRDNDSSAMLDIIFGTKSFDVGFMFDLGGFRSVLSDLVTSRSTAFESKLASKTASAEAAIEKMTAAFAEIG